MSSSRRSQGPRSAPCSRAWRAWWRSSAAVPRISHRSPASAVFPWCWACSMPRSASPTARRSPSTASPESCAGCADSARRISMRPSVFITQPVAPSATERLRSGMFPGAQSIRLEGAFVWGKTIGLIGGGGRIGRAVAKRARGFSMRLLYWGPRRIAESEERELDLAYVPLDRLLAESDFVSVHAPLKPETHHLIGARELALMKPTAFLVNTARGPVVDEQALVRALADRRIAGAALDVFEREPDVEPALVTMSNVVLTPHQGSAVAELREAMAHVVVDNIVAVLEGRRPPNCWNPEIYRGG